MANCLICFQKIQKWGFLALFFKVDICPKCFISLNRKPRIKSFNDIRVYSLYPYKDKIVSLIYQLKGCNDIALAPIFLNYDAFFLKLKFFNYILIPVPSYYEHDQNRGFNHVEKIFASLHLKMAKVLFKTKDYKQANLSKKEREVASKNIMIKKDITLENKNLLLVDDIVTTGNTILQCVSLLKTLNPKKIKIVTIAYSLSNY